MRASRPLAGLGFLLLSVPAVVAQGRTPAMADAATQTVRLSSGVVRGVVDGDVASFKGIPFAAPPVGPNRWRPPQPVAAWNDVREAVKFGASCAQASFPPRSGALAPDSAEDCLSVNVWKPAGVSPAAKLPVMVWIYGGAFVFGSGAQPSYSGVHFAKQGVVLVNFNYRLGRLGFFAFPALTEEHSQELKGNYAYMDQIAALRWVKQNIGAFGGDATNVTIFGESAGGVSVHTMLTSPLARGLFQKAILESSGGRDGVLTGRPFHGDAGKEPSAEAIGVNFAHKHGIDGTDEAALAKLRALRTEEIIDGGQESVGANGPVLYSGPILDGRLAVETPQRAYENGRGMRVPVLIGSNSADFVGFMAADSKEALFEQFGEGKATAIAAYDPNGSADVRTLLTLAGADRVQAEPARFTATIFTKSGQPAFVYRFSYVPKALEKQWQTGAPHGAEIPYVFDNLDAGGFGPPGPPSTAQDAVVARMMNTYWANFAKKGDPNGPGLPRWPRFEAREDNILEFQRSGSAVAGPDPLKARLDVTERAAQPDKVRESERRRR